MNRSRREALKQGLAAAAGLGVLPLAAAAEVATSAAASDTELETDRHSRSARPRAQRATYRQSVARWCFGRMPLDELCAAAARIGLQGIDLLSENEWSVPGRFGLRCAIANGPGPIPEGWNDPANHERLVAESERLLPLIAAAGIPQMIVFSGNRRGRSDADGIANCARGLARILPTAERLGVTVVMEMLNSKVDHRDYHAARTEWAAQLARDLGSEHFKLLYDVYHMQIMEGDVVRTIERYAPLIGHYHTAGNPGRHELDHTQELNYRRIAEAIAGTGFSGYVAHEFIPTSDPLGKLAEAVELFS